MTELNQLPVSFHISALIVCIMCLVFTCIQQRTDKPQNKLYLALVLVLFCNAGSSVMNDLILPSVHPDAQTFLLRRIMEYLYFTLHTALSPLFFWYVSSVCSAPLRKRPLVCTALMIPFTVTELMVLTNPVSRWVYYFDADRQFQRNWAEIFIYIAAALYMVFAFMMLLHAWSALTKKRKSALLCFLGVVLLGVGLQMLFPSVRVELFAEAIGLTGIMLAVESEDGLTDPDTGVYNRRALRMDLKSAFVNTHPFQLIGVRITDADRLAKMMGTENTDMMEEQVTEFLKTLAPRYHIYSINPGTFAVIFYDATEKQADSLARLISRRFEEPWHFGDREILLSCVVMSAGMPGQMSHASQAFFMLDSPIPTGNDKKILSGSDLDYLLRRSAVESAVTRGLEEHSFEVYYQPTYHMDGSRLHGAEALLRMHDKELGFLYPDEFIPVAEHIGMIDVIDDFVLEEVCRFIKTGIPVQCGMDCINVNLSVLQCMKPGFVEHINEIVERNGIDKHFLNFEITESVAADDYKLLSGVIADLKQEGFRFSMDDYGMGYSNMHAILSLNLDVIKIDKSILWGAEQNQLGYIILENTIRMIRQMQREILVEGVETSRQLELLGRLHVDYLQGYYFSRPIPLPEFIRLIQEQAKEEAQTDGDTQRKD